MWFLSQLILEGLLQNPPCSSDLMLIGPRPWCHTPQLIVMHVVSDLFSKYLNMPISKHASSCSAIRPNYQRQPQLMAFTI